jgi:hypothetical protein
LTQERRWCKVIRNHRGGANDNTAGNPGQFDHNIGVGNLVFSHPNGSQVGREGEKKASKTAKEGEEGKKAPQTIRRVDAEAGVRAMCGGSKARARSEARTTTKNRAKARAEAGDRHEEAILSGERVWILRMAGQREHHLERPSERGAVAATTMCSVW